MAHHHHTPDPAGLGRPGQEVVVVPLAEAPGLDLRDLPRSSAPIADSRTCAGGFLQDRLRLSA